MFNAYWIASRLMEQIGRPRVLVASGKVLEIQWIRQLVADLFGLAVQRADAADASVMGACALANVACGGMSLENVLAQGRPREDSAELTPTRVGAFDEKFKQYQYLCSLFNAG